MSLNTTTITLGRQTFTVAELPFGRLKRVLPAIAGILPRLEKPEALDTEAFDAMLFAVHQAIEAAGGVAVVTIPDLEALPIRPDELASAVAKVVELISGRPGGAPGN